MLMSINIRNNEKTTNYDRAVIIFLALNAFEVFLEVVLMSSATTMGKNLE